MKWAVSLVILATYALAPLLGQDTGSSRPELISLSLVHVRAIDALLSLSRAGGVPIGVVEGDSRLCSATLSYSAKNASILSVAQGIVGEVPGYRVIAATDHSILSVAPEGLPPAAHQFLRLVMPQYGPVKGTPQELLMSLWVHVRFLLHPQEGSAVSILGSPSDRELEIQATNETVRQVLDRIAIASRGVWILRSLPENLETLGGEVPFAILSPVGESTSETADLCAPVLAP